MSDVKKDNAAETNKDVETVEEVTVPKTPRKRRTKKAESKKAETTVEEPTESETFETEISDEAEEITTTAALDDSEDDDEGDILSKMYSEEELKELTEYADEDNKIIEATDSEISEEFEFTDVNNNNNEVDDEEDEDDEVVDAEDAVDEEGAEDEEVNQEPQEQTSASKKARRSAQRRKAKQKLQDIRAGSYNGEETMRQQELVSLIKSFIKLKMPVPVTVIGSDTHKIGPFVLTCAVCQMEKPFERFKVYVPYNYMFTLEEKAYLKEATRPASGQSTEDQQAFALRFVLGGRTEVMLEKISENETGIIVTGNRSKALAKRQWQYFERGRLNATGKRCTAQKGSRVRNCNVFIVTDNSAFVDICGVSTEIPIRHLTYYNTPSIYDVVKPGNTVNVLISDVYRDERNRLRLEASVKLYNKEDPTLPALERAAKRLDPKGRTNYRACTTAVVCYVNREKHRFHIYTDMGYNAIALHHNIYGKHGTLNAPPHKGSRVIFQPIARPKNANFMIGYITEVLS